MSARRSADSKGVRGQPVVMLAVLLVGWSALRAATWVSPLPEDYHAAQASEETSGSNVSNRGAADRRYHLHSPDLRTDRPADAPVSPTIAPAEAPMEGGWNDPANSGQSRRSLFAPGEPEVPVASRAGPQAANGRPSPMRMAAGHTLLAAAGFSSMEVPPEIAAFFRRETGANNGSQAPSNPRLAAARLPDAPRQVSEAGRASRWSGDGWLLWRDDTTTPFTSGRPSYGRSQLGAVVRYELAPTSAHRPQAYVRGSAALQGASEQEVAAGLSARPLAKLPIRLAAEMRVSERAAGSEVRAAAYAVTELAPQPLPGGLEARAYAQAGYVGGSYSTAFVDGQVQVDRSLASVGDFDLRAGAAIWGGAQDDGERLDIGPSASVTFRMGDARGRVAADYRFRVAGDAEPSSGPALTLSAGF